MSMNDRIVRIAMLCALCAGFLRCATISYHERMSSYGRESREFEDVLSSDKVYQGVAVEEAVIKNKKYYHLQFEGPLAGAGRYLDIYLPVDYDKEKMIITETSTKLSGMKKAFLLVEHYCCSEGYKDIFENYNEKAVTDPAVVIKNNFQADVAEKDFPVFFLNLTFSNVKKFGAQYVIWSLKEGGGAAVTVGFHLDQPYSLIDVRWKKRNPFVLGLIKVGYIAPVIADIISSPIQLIGVIIYFAMGGAVK